MPLHLIKLCVGADSVADLEEWVEERVRDGAPARQPPRSRHITRMVPTRAAEIVDGGSLYWVIKGQIAARQRMLEIEPFVDVDGIGRCRLWLEPEVVKVAPRPMRPFQGWRYLAEKDAPDDLGASARRRCRRRCGARWANSACYDGRSASGTPHGDLAGSPCGIGAASRRRCRRCRARRGRRW